MSGSSGNREARAEFSSEVRRMRAALKSLPVRVSPGDLDLRLRIMASQEASRRRLALKHPFGFARQTAQRWLGELMRPIAIPTAGGFFSALLLFGVIAPPLAMRGDTGLIADVPTGLYQEASVKSSLPFGYDGDAVLVEISVDEDGRMIDYAMAKPYYLKSPELRRNIETHLLTMVFNPARSFGQPMVGKLRLWFRTNRIDVRG